MSDYGLFEAASDAEQSPRRKQRIAAAQMTAALQQIHGRFGSFLANADDSDSFEDRWLMSKKDIFRVLQANQVGQYPAVVREVHGSLKSAWLAKQADDDRGYDTDDDSTDEKKDKKDDGFGGKKAPPFGKDKKESRRRFADFDEHAGDSPDSDFVPGDHEGDRWEDTSKEGRRRHAEDRSAPFQDLAMGRDHSNAELIPEDWNDPSNSETPAVQGDFMPGGDSSGTDRFEDGRMARRRRAAPMGDMPTANGSTGDMGLGGDTGLNAHDMAGLSRIEMGHPGMDAWAAQGQHEGARREAARMVADLYTDWANGNRLRVASMNTLDVYASTGMHDQDYYLLAGMIRKANEDCDCDEDGVDDREEEDSDDDSDEDSDDDYGDEDESGSDEDGDGEDDAEESDDDDSYDDDDSDSDDQEDDSDDSPFGGADDDGGSPEEGSQDDFFGGQGEDPSQDPSSDVEQTYEIPDQAPDLPPEMMDEIPQDDTSGDQPIGPELVDQILGLPEGTIESLIVQELQGQQGEDPMQQGPPQQMMGRRRKRAYDASEDHQPRRGPRHEWSGVGDTEHGAEPALDYPSWGEDGRPTMKWKEGPSAGEGRHRSEARRQRRAMGEDPTQAAGDPAAQSQQQQPPMDPSQGQEAPPADPSAGAAPDGAPDEGALLDTAMQSVQQMIEQKTQEFQQVMDPLQQAQQALDYAQQVDQAANPLDVTPPEGTVDAAPSAAPGGAQDLQQQQPPMQQQARRQASRGRRPFVFDLGREGGARTAAEGTLSPVTEADSFAWPTAKVPTGDPDKNTTNNLPKMPGSSKLGKGKTRAAKGVLPMLNDVTKTRTTKGLPASPAATLEDLKSQAPDLTESQIGKAQKSLGLATAGKRKQASFFTRKVAGWSWDDHLNGYVSKTARKFTCACGEDFATPSYGTCRCGRLWNSYAVGNNDHLASNSADMFITREIPVRDNVIVASRKKAQCEFCGGHGHDWTVHPEAHDDVRRSEREMQRLEFPFGDHHESSRKRAWTSDDGWTPPEKRDVDWVDDEDREDADAPHAPGKNARLKTLARHRAAEVFRDAGWHDEDDGIIKYDDDGDDPARRDGPKKPPSTKLKGGDPKWHSRQDGGKFKSTSPFKG